MLVKALITVVLLQIINTDGLNSNILRRLQGIELCKGYYLDGDDTTELLEPDLLWCCNTCDCTDIADERKQGCPPGSVTPRYPEEDESPTLRNDPLDPEYPEYPEDNQDSEDEDTTPTKCQGYYLDGNDTTVLLEPELVWCCNGCDCTDIADERKQGCPPKLLKGPKEPKDSEDTVTPEDPEDPEDPEESEDKETRPTICQGYYLDGNDTSVLLEPELVWCCNNCDCTDIVDERKQGCPPGLLKDSEKPEESEDPEDREDKETRPTKCQGYYLDGNDTSVLLEPELVWCCNDCDCTDIADERKQGCPPGLLKNREKPQDSQDATTPKEPEDPEDPKEREDKETQPTICQGYYLDGNDTTVLLEPELVWCCNGCDCTDIVDERKQGCPPGLLKNRQKPEDSQDETTPQEPEYPENPEYPESPEVLTPEDPDDKETSPTVCQGYYLDGNDTTVLLEPELVWCCNDCDCTDIDDERKQGCPPGLLKNRGKPEDSLDDTTPEEPEYPENPTYPENPQNPEELTPEDPEDEKTSPTICEGYYLDGNDTTVLLEPELVWCCNDCDCTDIVDERKQGCPPGLLKNRKKPEDSQDATTPKEPEYPENPTYPENPEELTPEDPADEDTTPTICQGYYLDGDSTTELLEPELVWCCNECDCTDIADERKQGCPPGLLKESKESKDSEDPEYPALGEETSPTECQGYYAYGDTTTELLEPELVWCCNECDCTDIADERKQGCPPGFANRDDENEDEETPVDSKDPEEGEGRSGDDGEGRDEPKEPKGKSSQPY